LAVPGHSIGSCCYCWRAPTSVSIRALSDSVGERVTAADSAPAQKPPADDAQSVSCHGPGDTEDTWTNCSNAPGSGTRTRNWCCSAGRPDTLRMGQSAMGRFTVHRSKVYIDLRFYDDLKRRFGAPATLPRLMWWPTRLPSRPEPARDCRQGLGGATQMGQPSQSLSVRMELQADCLAGVWLIMPTRRGRYSSRGCRGRLAAASAIATTRYRGARRAMSCRMASPWHFRTAGRMVQARLSMGDMNACDTSARTGSDAGKSGGATSCPMR